MIRIYHLDLKNDKIIHNTEVIRAIYSIIAQLIYLLFNNLSNFKYYIKISRRYIYNLRTIILSQFSLERIIFFRSLRYHRLGLMQLDDCVESTKEITS
jgi:hypothetical protein